MSRIPPNWLLLPKNINKNKRAANAFSAVWFVWVNFPKHATLQFAAMLAMLVSMTAWGGIVGGTVENAITLNTWSEGTRAATLSTLLIIIQIACGAVLLLNDLSLKKSYFARLEQRMRSARLHAEEFNDFDRARSRDILLIADLMSSGVSLVFSPVALLCCGVFFYCQFGFAGLAGVASIAFATFVSAWIAHRSSKLALRLIQSGEIRMTLVSRWLKSGKSLLSWNAEGPLLNQLHSATVIESKTMNKDSLLRAIEGYIEVFAIAIPLIAAGVIAWFNNRLMTGSIGYAWAVLPSVGVVMGLSRHFAHCSQVAQVFENLECGTRSCSPTPDFSTEVIRIDESWSLFDGTISRNVDPDGASPRLAEELVHRFRLTDEACTSKFEVIDDGANLSAGQRIRVLVARAFVQAAMRAESIHLADSLSSLDDNAIWRIRTAAERLGISVKWHPEVDLRIAGQKETQDAITSRAKESSLVVEFGGSEHGTAVAKKSDSNGTIAELWCRSRPVALGFLLAAGGIFCLPQIATLNHDLPNLWMTTVLTVVGIGSFLIASLVNYLVECQLRSAAVTAHSRLLIQVGEIEARDHAQRLGRDYQAVIGRLTWYVSDISWIASITSLTFASLAWGFGALGVSLIAAFLLVATMLWKMFAAGVVSARRATVTGMNDFLASTENLKRLSGLPNATAAKLRMEFVSRGFKRLADTQLDSQRKKTGLAYAFSTLTSVTLMVASGYAMNSQQGNNAAFILTALLAFTGSSTQLILAMVGFMAQQHSYKRLEEFREPDAVVPHIELTAQAFRINTFENTSQKIRYRESLWPFASLTTLVGASGTGKTQFLSRASSEMYLQPTAGKVKSLYFSRDASLHLGGEARSDWKECLLQIVCRHSTSARLCVFFDEVTSNLPEPEAKAFIAQVFEKVSSTGGMMVLVDHRLSIGKLVQLETLIERSVA